MDAAKPLKVLIVDDEIRMVKSLEILLRSEGGYQVERATNAVEALQKLDASVDVLVTDLTMPGRDGLSLLKEAKERHPALAVIMMTAYSSVQSAVEALKFGASEYLVKPFENEQFLAVLKKAASARTLSEENREAFSALSEREKYGELIGKSATMHQVYYLIDRAAQSDSTVLITGESGTGKELVARAIHYNGLRKNGPFVAVNCNALPATLLESELFGHLKGAFTGADQSREGRFSRADGGTIFLDEIGELSPDLQVKFLRVLQEKTFEPVGSTKPQQVDVRVVAATNRNLEETVKSGQLREDLYYRLHVLHIHIPPLRERRDDISLLADYFMNKKSHLLKAGPKRLAEAAREVLLQFHFPGNVRQLENMIERAIVLSTEEEIQLQDLPDLTHRSEVPVAEREPRSGPGMVEQMPLHNAWQRLSEMTRQTEEALLRRALRENPGLSNQELADLLGTSRRVLELRLQQFGIHKSSFKPPS